MNYLMPKFMCACFYRMNLSVLCCFFFFLYQRKENCDSCHIFQSPEVVSLFTQQFYQEVSTHMHAHTHFHILNNNNDILTATNVTTLCICFIITATFIELIELIIVTCSYYSNFIFFFFFSLFFNLFIYCSERTLRIN